MLAQIFCVVSVLLSVSHAATDADTRQKFLDCHNYLRAQLALGKVDGQPAAADMTVMDYDTLLEERAIAWNDQCKAGHDSDEHRMVRNEKYKKAFHGIGQNWAGTSSGSLSKFSCNGWWNEYVDYDFATNSKKDPEKMIGHYTQMAWAKSTLVGCAIKTSCPQNWQARQYGQHATCNYAGPGNFNGQKPYIEGPACSQCPDGFNMCMNGALCARPDQCERRGSGASCKCALKCHNGGVLDETACSCKCTSDFYGHNCQRKCEDDPKVNYCGYNNICNQDPYFAKKCKKTCNKCENDKPFVTAFSASIKDNINPDWPNARFGGSDNIKSKTTTAKPETTTTKNNNGGETEATTTVSPQTTTSSKNEECFDYKKDWCEKRKGSCKRCYVVDVLCPLTCNTCERSLKCRDNSRQCASAKKYNCKFFFKQLCRETCSDCAGNKQTDQSGENKPAEASADCKNYSQSYCDKRSNMCWCPIVKALCPETCNSCDERRKCKDIYGSTRCGDANNCSGYWKYLCRQTCNLC